MYALSADGNSKVSIKYSEYTVYNIFGVDGKYWTVKWELVIAGFTDGREGIGKITIGGQLKIATWNSHH